MPKPFLIIIFLLVILTAAGTGAYLFWPKAEKEKEPAGGPAAKPPDTIRLSWLLEKMGEDEKTGAPLTRVRVDFKGKTSKGYDVGTYTGDCFEIAKSRWELLENEIAGVICGWGGAGDEIGVFKENGKFVIKHGTLAEGAPATEGSPAVPHFRGDFKPLLAIELEGWLPYEFHKTTDYGFKKPFLFFYPPDGKIEKASEFRTAEYSLGPPDKLVLRVDNQKCWLIILPPGMGIEEPPPDFSAEKQDIDIAGKKWETLIWKVKDKITLFNFINKEDENYTFSVNPENLGHCLDTYKMVLSTFKFID